MGLFHVKGQLTGPTGNVEEVEFLVDTRCDAPASGAARSGGKARVEIDPFAARGDRWRTAQPWPIAEAKLALNGPNHHFCIIAPAGPALSALSPSKVFSLQSIPLVSV